MNDNLLDGIAPKGVSHEIPVAEKKFRGWHKPRKQLVRREQWLSEISTLLPQLRLDGKVLRYLTLPGEDMFDVRLLAQFCKEKKLTLKPLGFDEARSSQTEVNISSNEVSSEIEPGSIIVVPDNISVLKNNSSQGFMYIKEKGPFDVINLDLCGSISCIDHPDNHQVLNNLCEYQVNNRREPWLLFITTRAEYEQVNLDHLPSYLQRLKENALSSSDFLDRLVKITSFNALEYEAGAIPNDYVEENEGSCFVKLFAIGLAKWLLKLMIEGFNKWSLEMLDSYWYRVEDNQTPRSFPNMLSLAFKFSPVDVTLFDSSGLATSNPSLKVNEESLALAILEKLDGLIDLDRKIDGDGSLYNDLLKESVALLKAARYPIDQYVEWAEQKRIRFSTN